VARKDVPKRRFLEVAGLIKEGMGRLLGGSVVGAPLEYALDALYGLLHRELLRDGATEDERRRSLPGDDLVRDTMWEATRAETILARPNEIWPWLVQMGYGRGGWYSWSPFVDAASRASADSVLPALQTIAPGDVMLDGPGCNERLGAWTVESIEPDRALILYSLRDPLSGRELDPRSRGARYIDCSWAFVLFPQAEGSTRLLVRTRLRFAPKLASPALRFWFGPGDTVMQRTMLKGIRERAETGHASVVGEGKTA
jgi:hypothetical protein